MEVAVQDGVVTERGTVKSREVKRLTEALAEAVSGVTEVHNRLRLRPGLQPGHR